MRSSRWSIEIHLARESDSLRDTPANTVQAQAGLNPKSGSTAQPQPTLSDLVPEEVFHDAAFAFLNAQISSSDVLDSRASQVLSVGTASLPLTIALVNARGTTILDEPFWDRPYLQYDKLPIICFFVALAAYVWILHLSREIGRKSRIEFKPLMSTMSDAFLEMQTQPLGGRGLKAWVARYYVESTNDNQQLLYEKSRMVSRIQLVLVVEGVALTLGATLALFG